MESSNTLWTILKVWVLLLAAGVLYYIWSNRAAPQLENQIEQEQETPVTNVAVRIGAIKQMTLHGYVVGYGNVEPEPATADHPAAEARVTIAWPAVISEVRCVEGQQVDKGQALFVVDRNIFGSEIGRLRKLLGDTQPATIPDELTVTSPIAGTVAALDVHPGEVALPTAAAVDIVNTDRLDLRVSIPAWQAGSISPGQQASIDLPADPATSSTPIDSTVQRIDPGVDPKTNLATVDVGVPAHRKIRPGEFGRVSIASESLPDCLVVPADSIVRDSLDRPFIAMVSDDHKQATLKLVEPGLREGDWVQVKAAGLAAGQTIVTTGAYGLLFQSGITVLNP
jgi:membrane fusion protein, multidrug efflux system